MSSMFLGKRRSYNKYALLLLQQKKIEKYFPFLQCQIVDNVLVCIGSVQPENCSKYKIKIEYVAGHEPKTTILYPYIEPCKKIHMYQDHSLCLRYPPDMRWNERVDVYKYTIPWISEWIIFYEIYLLNGNKWDGPESPTHITEDDKNVNKDVD